MSEKNFDMENATVIPREIAESTDLDKVLEWLEANNKNGSFAVEQGTAVINLGGERPDDDEEWQKTFSDIEELFIPDSVTKIGVYAFCGCAFEAIDIPLSVTEIGAHAFEYCYRLEKIEVPYSVTEIGYRAFSDCQALEIARLPFYDEDLDLFSFCRKSLEIFELVDGDTYAWCE